jgi:anti-anti-sigma regulatory factor
MLLESDGMARAIGEAIDSWEEAMLDLTVEKIGDLALVECVGRIVRSEAAFKLHEAVTSLRDSRIIVLDVSEVSAIEGGGLGMLLVLQRWAHDCDTQLKLFNPRRYVRDRLERIASIPEFDIATPHEMKALLANAGSRVALAA